MNTPDSSNPDFEAMKAMTRLRWLLNFEALALVPDKSDAFVAKDFVAG